MPATDYPELQGMPAGCTQTQPWGFDPVQVRAPYMGVDESVVLQAPLISPDWPQAQFEMFNGENVILDLDAPGVSIGYATEDEQAVHAMLRQGASALKSNTALYHPDAKDGIVALATDALEILSSEIPGIYAKYDIGGQVSYPSTKGGFAFFPLSVPDDEVVLQVEPSPQPVNSMQARAQDRDRIREAYLEAIYFMWCALYGANQSIAWRENKKLWDQTQGGGGIEVPKPIPPPRMPKAPIPTVLIPGETAPPIPPLPPGFPGEGEEPEYQPEPPKKKKAGGAGVAIALGLAAAALLLKK